MIPRLARRFYRRLFPACNEWRQKGSTFASQWTEPHRDTTPATTIEGPSVLEAFFDAREEGQGIWKWRHYFDIYYRYLNSLRQRDKLVILEIGIYSGGSLEMWRDFFGSSASIYGVDIESACRSYERPGTHVLIGDQADRSFWRRVLEDGTLPPPDVVIDDGGHTPEQQRVTMEELLPNIRPGGVYICEDVHGRNNPFAEFVYGFVDSLNGMDGSTSNPSNPKRRIVVPANSLQAAIHSVHIYPFVVVIEKRDTLLNEFVAPKHGTQWEPFLQ